MFRNELTLPLVPLLRALKLRDRINLHVKNKAVETTVKLGVPKNSKSTWNTAFVFSSFQRVVFARPSDKSSVQAEAKLNPKQYDDRTLAGSDFSTSFFTRLNRYGASSLCKS